MQIPNAHYLIIDLEATCSDRAAASHEKSVPRDEMEIIEIGAVMLDARSYETAGEFQTFIRPVRHPELTPFCRELTHITQSDVDFAPLFPAAITALQTWMRDFDDALFCSWGDYDRNQFQQDCTFHGVPYPFASGHLNLKAKFSESLGVSKRFGLDGAIHRLGLEFTGTHHRGIDDARSIARVVQRVCRGR